MLKIMSIAIVLFGLTNEIYSQTKIVPKTVEARMNQNRKSQKSTFEGVSVIYSFENVRLESRDHADHFDKYVLHNFGEKVKSCETSDANSGFNSVIIADGFVTADDIKFITMRAGGNIVSWKAVYVLSENVNLPVSKIDTRSEVSKSEYDQMPKDKKDRIDNNPSKYVIVNK